MSTAALTPDLQAPTGNLDITVSRAELLRELTAAQSVVERKTTIPILSNFLFEVSDEGVLTITATDLDQSLKTSCPARVKKSGACTVPARKLYDYIKLLPEGDISIKLQDNHWVQIRAGRSNTKMVGMARANFPAVPEFPGVGVFKINAANLRNMISKTIFAISNEESRYTLNGALLVLKAESMAMVATDGHRLAHIEKTGENMEVSGEKKTLIPRKALAELMSLLNNSDAETLEFADDDQTLFFRIGGRVLTSRKLTGQFPNYEAVLPRDNTKFVIVRSEDLMGSIQRVAQFADERSGAIKIRLEQNELKLSAQSTDAGESEDIIETPYNYDPLVVGFNSSYLVDFLKATGNTGEVRLEFKDAQSAGQMRPEDGNEEVKYRYILMPMRI
ncbi:DNA polymerase III subunit beta [Granulicella cerasi]|uniref:Beta sliding clamp n=1 Tax=Granulicella cerasi TaxID=741063 RepID=A0ABW1ZAD3_9BACT|nr:DNA polymerase III subunit beta [Granulicella cerasi]